MGVTWLSLSTKWGLTSVQAAVTMFISVIGTLGVWMLSSYWWQRPENKTQGPKPTVPSFDALSSNNLGDGPQTLRLQRWKLFTMIKTHVFSLLRLATIVVVTLACMLAGPIAKVSVRSTVTLQSEVVNGLRAWNSGPFGCSLNDNIKWNDTITSLDQAEFPHDQLLNVLPPATLPWKYSSSEWDPTWLASCDFHEETLLHGLEATGNASLSNALEAFPRFRDTYEPFWLNSSTMRTTVNFNGQQDFTVKDVYNIKDMFIWFIVQSDPMVENRFRTNQGDLHLSISALHAQNFAVSVGNDATGSGADDWRPYGPVLNASYTRVDCNITKTPKIIDQDLIPWLWTNDTSSIAKAYSVFYMRKLGEKSTKNLLVVPPPPYELFRFYQAYMAATNTWHERSSMMKISVWKDTVQLSTACLVLILWFVCLEVWLTGRYMWFLRHNKSEITHTCILDEKVDWTVYNGLEAERDRGPPVADANLTKIKTDRA